MPNIGIRELKNHTPEIIRAVRLNDQANVAFRNATAPIGLRPGAGARPL